MDGVEKLFPRLLAGIHIQLYHDHELLDEELSESSWIKSTVFLSIDEKVVILLVSSVIFFVTHRVFCSH